jgi:hypothetical protein
MRGAVISLAAERFCSLSDHSKLESSIPRTVVTPWPIQSL